MESNLTSVSQTVSFKPKESKEGLNLPACLIIMDGYGLDDPSDKNAISLADTPNLDTLFSDCEWTMLQASGEAVGLPAGQMGNSEVGHLNIGAGRIVHQELSRINHACADGSLAENAVIQDAFANVNKSQSVLHLMGLLSDGGVHSSNEHLYALMRSAVDAGVSKVMIHCFLDGRDVPPSSAAIYVEQLEKQIEEMGCSTVQNAKTQIEIASLMGRYYAMDRDKRWDRVEKAYDTLVCAENFTDLSPLSVLEQSYEQGVTDEFVVPVCFDRRGMKSGDSVIFFNFRPDRAREITRAIVDPEFSGFSRKCSPQVHFVCLTEYDPTIDAPVAFPKEFPSNVLADVLASEGLSQYHIAETEKYAHVTFFFNGGLEEEKPGESRVLIASPKVATYDMQPEMSEPEVADTLAKAILDDEADVYIVNFANCDMVGHTGDIEAAKSAVEAVDEGVAEVLEAIRKKGGFALITADHGNADNMRSDDGTPHTAHTTAPVPLILFNPGNSEMHLSDCEGKLADIAPTLLEGIGITSPEEMMGESLLM